MRTSRAELCGGWVQWGKTVYEDPEYFSVIDSYIIDFRLRNMYPSTVKSCAIEILL